MVRKKQKFGTGERADEAQLMETDGREAFNETFVADDEALATDEFEFFDNGMEDEAVKPQDMAVGPSNRIGKNNKRKAVSNVGIGIDVIEHDHSYAKRRRNDTITTQLFDETLKITNIEKTLTDYNREQKRKGREKEKRGPNYLDAEDHNKAKFIELSDFTLKCNRCKALQFSQDHNSLKASEGGFLGCCSYGKLESLKNTIDPYPEDLKCLFNPNNAMHKSFIANIRKINSDFSFASLSCFNFTFPTPGPPVFKIQGQVYHKLNKVAKPEDDVNPTNGQLYFLDPAESIEERLKDCGNKEIYRHIDLKMREYNFFANSYQTMKEVYEFQEQQARENGTEMPEVKLLFSLKEGFDKRRYNLPVCDEVFAIILCDAEDQVIPANYVVNLKGKKELMNVYPLDPIIEPMTYPLFYPLGTRGWNKDLKDTKDKKISLCDYVKYRLYYREPKDLFLPHHHGKKLFQQWCVDQWTRIEWERLMFIRSERFQKNMAKSNYQNILDFMNKKNAGKELEKKMVILPSSFTNGPRNLHENFMDSMTIMAETGKPDLFITFTCNPNDPDILKCLLPGQTPNDRPDIISRVFKLKKDLMIELIMKKECFGKTVANVWVIEFQKRGLPHVHLLVTLDSKDKLRNAQKIDRLISAEIPHENEDYYDLVTKNMMHGPCNEKSPCWNHQKKKCGKNFPKEFSDETKINEDGYPTYKRPNNGRSIEKKGVALSNQYVVPYSPYLLKSLRAHCNVEKVADIKAVKYLYKYIHKGLDGATVECVTYDENGQKKVLKYDEVSNYLDARCLSSAEACWRIFKNPLQGKSHSVMALPVHLEGEKIVYFDPEADEEAIKEKMSRNSQLEAYFEFMNKNPDKVKPNGERYLYRDMPKYCTWIAQKGHWKDRAGRYNSLGRLYSVNPKETEKYYLYYLLLNVPGTSFKDMKTFEGVEYPTFAQACLARGLCRDDGEWRNCLKEASVFKMPSALRSLFANIMVHCNPKYPEKLWEEFKNDLSEDIIKKFPNLPLSKVHEKGLYLIEVDLKSHDKSLKDFKTMPQKVDSSGMNDSDEDDLFDPTEELSKANAMINGMNAGQKAIIEALRFFFETGKGQECIYIDGPGGTGKTFLLIALYHLARGNRKKVCNMAFSGMAATMLKKGRTLHNKFKLPLDITDLSYSNLENKGKEVDLIKETDIFIWDEAPMASKHILKIIDKKLRELTKVNKPFGGKTFILSGDFRQCLPIKKHALRSEIEKLLIKKSPLWKHFAVHKLTENLRADPNEKEFAKKLVEIGDGIANEDGHIELPLECICEGNLVEEIFGDIFRERNYSELANRAILATMNSTVDSYNMEALESFPGDYAQPYFSIDETDPKSNFPASLELLNSSKCSSLPDHEIKLKKDCIIMLIRNINIKQGLCNGTRLQVVNPGKNLLNCIILNGDHVGETVFIPRITLNEDRKFPYVIRRHQFPIKLAFSYTINKSQSQTFKKIGIDFQSEVFSHGQTYVALSRAKSWKGIKVKLHHENSEKKIRNIVWQEVL